MPYQEPILSSNFLTTLQSLQRQLDNLVQEYSGNAIKAFERKITLADIDPSFFYVSDFFDKTPAFRTSLIKDQQNQRTEHILKIGNMTLMLAHFADKKSVKPFVLTCSLLSYVYDAFHTHLFIRSNESRENFTNAAKHIFTSNAKTTFVSSLTPLVKELKEKIAGDLMWRSTMHARDFGAHQTQQGYDQTFKDLEPFYNNLAERLKTLSGLSNSGMASMMPLINKANKKNQICNDALKKLEYLWTFIRKNKMAKEEFLAGVMSTLMEAYYECVFQNFWSKAANHETLLLEYMQECEKLFVPIIAAQFEELREHIGQRQNLDMHTFKEDNASKPQQPEERFQDYFKPKQEEPSPFLPQEDMFSGLSSPQQQQSETVFFSEQQQGESTFFTVPQQQRVATPPQQQPMFFAQQQQPQPQLQRMPTQQQPQYVPTQQQSSSPLDAFGFFNEPPAQQQQPQQPQPQQPSTSEQPSMDASSLF